MPPPSAQAAQGKEIEYEIQFIECLKGRVKITHSEAMAGAYRLSMSAGPVPIFTTQTRTANTVYRRLSNGTIHGFGTQVHATCSLWWHLKFQIRFSGWEAGKPRVGGNGRID